MHFSNCKKNPSFFLQYMGFFFQNFYLVYFRFAQLNLCPVANVSPQVKYLYSSLHLNNKKKSFLYDYFINHCHVWKNSLND